MPHALTRCVWFHSILVAICVLVASRQLYASNKGNEIYMDELRERVHLAASKVQETSDHLVDLDNVKQYARAQIRDAERLLLSSELKEQQAQAQLNRFKVEVR